MSNEKTLITAREIHDLISVKNKTVNEVAAMYGLTRPHIQNHIRLHKLPNLLKSYFLDGSINFTPIIDAYDKYGIACLPALKKCIEDNKSIPDGKSKKVTLPQLIKSISDTYASYSESSEVGSADIKTDDHLKESLSDNLALIRTVLTESHQASSSYSTVIVSSHSCSVILNALIEMESMLGICPSLTANKSTQKPSQMITDTPSNDYLDQTPQIEYEDISQDIYDHEID